MASVTWRRDLSACRRLKSAARGAGCTGKPTAVRPFRRSQGKLLETGSVPPIHAELQHGEQEQV